MHNNKMKIEYKSDEIYEKYGKLLIEKIKYFIENYQISEIAFKMAIDTLYDQIVKRIGIVCLWNSDYTKKYSIEIENIIKDELESVEIDETDVITIKDKFNKIKFVKDNGNKIDRLNFISILED